MVLALLHEIASYDYAHVRVKNREPEKHIEGDFEDLVVGVIPLHNAQYDLIFLILDSLDLDTLPPGLITV